jgi:nucleotide-binding universal stress UspA family protein
VDYGPLLDVVDQEAKKSGADLVVVHTRQRSTFSLMGSHATDLVRASHVPVLELPSGLKEFRLRRILFADDGSAIERATLNTLVTLAERTKAEVIIAHVATGRPMNERTDHRHLFGSVLKGLITREVMVEHDDVVEALLRTAENEQADLIAVLHRHGGVAHDLFHRSTARGLEAAGVIPVLALEQ